MNAGRKSGMAAASSGFGVTSSKGGAHAIHARSRSFGFFGSFAAYDLDATAVTGNVRLPSSQRSRDAPGRSRRARSASPRVRSRRRTEESTSSRISGYLRCTTAPKGATKLNAMPGGAVTRTTPRGPPEAPCPAARDTSPAHSAIRFAGSTSRSPALVSAAPATCRWKSW